MTLGILLLMLVKTACLDCLSSVIPSWICSQNSLPATLIETQTFSFSEINCLFCIFGLQLITFPVYGIISWCQMCQLLQTSDSKVQYFLVESSLMWFQTSYFCNKLYFVYLFLLISFISSRIFFIRLESSRLGNYSSTLTPWFSVWNFKRQNFSPKSSGSSLLLRSNSEIRFIISK